MRSFFLILAVVATCANLQAATALFKQIPPPSGFIGLGSEANQSRYAPENNDDHWNPGFRTATTSTHAFVVGHTWSQTDGSGRDGFIAKLDPAGGVVWSKSMGEIMGGTLGWPINDVAVYQDHLYVIGTRTDGQAFVAKVTTNGTRVDFTLIHGTGSNAASRGNSIYVSIVDSEPQIFVSGDARGDGMAVQQRQLSAPASVFSNLVIHHDTDNGVYHYDTFILRMDTRLAPNWGLTLGIYNTNDYGAAIAADGTGAVFVAIKHQNPDANGSARMHWVDDGRKTVTSSNPNGTSLIDFDAYNNLDYYPGSWSIVYRLITTDEDQPVRSHFTPTLNEEGEWGTSSRVTDLEYFNGALYAAGEWQGWLRPASHYQAVPGRTASSANDVWTARLDPTTMHHQSWRLFQSSADDFVNQISVSGGKLYLTGVAGASLSHRTFFGASTTIGGSSNSHLFWTQLSTPNLDYNWHVFPEEDTSNSISIPNTMRVSGVAAVGDSVMLVGSWNGGTLTMGESDNRKTLESPSSGADHGFAGFLQENGSWLEEISITIASEYGNPTPHSGTDTVATGQSITASVPSEVYEDALGNVIDNKDAEAIRNRAVTRRICTGYQFEGSDVNGTVNSVTFVPTTDTRLTFLWRTEHAIEIESDIVGSEGLTSTAAGNPDPAVQKHWIHENDQFTAFIDGSEETTDLNGVRWLSTGYVAEGSVAEGAGVDSGSLVLWEEFQDRQQIPKITVGGPGRIVYRWRKQLSLRVSVNSSVAEDTPRAFSDRPQPSSQSNPRYPSPYSFDYHFDSPVQLRQLKVRPDPDNIENLPAKLYISYKHSNGNYYVAEYVELPDMEAEQVYTLNLADNGNYSNDWLISGTGSDHTYVEYPHLAMAEVSKVDFDSNNPPTGAHIKRGAGEFWFEPGASVTISADTPVSSGTSLLELKGYTGAQGSIEPFEAFGVTSKTFTIDEPSLITWDFARAIYPETVNVGDAVTFSGITGIDATNVNKSKAPLGGSVIEAPSGSTLDQMYQWDDVAKKLYVLRPGKFTVEFENSASPDDAAQNVIVEVTAQWPSSPDYTHILEAPEVNLDASNSDENAFLQLAYTEGDAQVENGMFSTSEPGRSVLIFSQRPGEVATGNLQQETLDVRVVNSLRWPVSAGGVMTNVTIGEAITNGGHDSESVGHNGYVLPPLAPVNTHAYDRLTMEGPIFAVNERFPNTGRWQEPVPGTTNGLIVHYPLDEVSGEPFRDRISGEATSFYSHAKSNPDHAHPGVDLEAFHGDDLRTPGSVGNGITNRLTLSAWIKPETIGNWNGIISKGTSNISYTLGLWNTGQLIFAVNGGVDTTWWSSGTVSNSVWSHVAVTYDGSTIRFYINGELAGEESGSFSVNASSESLVFGVDLPGDPERFDGILRDLRVYNRALPESEIAGLTRVTNLGASPGDMAVAWYQVQDNIRWPYKAVHYNPQWPQDSERIVIASRLGSEGASHTEFHPSQNAIPRDIPERYYWNRPEVSSNELHPEKVAYQAMTINPNSLPCTIKVSSVRSLEQVCYLYSGSFDPDRPFENLINRFLMPYSWADVYTLTAGQPELTVVVSQLEPDSPRDFWYVTPYNDSTFTFLQPEAFGGDKTDPAVYYQNDPTQPGYNPNEEHALVAPSYTDASRPAIFALHNDLNRTDADDTFTSEPRVLVQYTDQSDPENPVVKMKTYTIVEEDGNVTDGRLPAFNQSYTFSYENEAGKQLNPPYPLSLVLGGSAMPEETNGENVDGRVAYYEDRDNRPWVVSGDTDPEPDIKAAFYYPLRADFWHPTATLGEPVPFAELTSETPRNVDYNTVWPDDVAVLKAGETLTFAGGEYATDHSGDATPPEGLPQAVAWQSGEVVFDSSNASMLPEVIGENYLARVVPALEAREVDLPLTSLPEELQPAAGNLIVEGLLWRFKDLSASLQERIYYDSSNNKLGVRGLLNGKILGDSDLLETPGAQTILQPNVLTTQDEALIKTLSTAPAWLNAVTAMSNLSRNPNDTNLAGVSTGIEPDPETTNAHRYTTNFGPGLAVVTNPDLQDPATSGALPEGYITIAENDDESLGTPVAMHVIKVSREKYRGSIAVMKPGNVFDEKLTLRHTADFGGDVSQLYFEWYYREENGENLNPPGVNLPTAGTPTSGDWTVFDAGAGLNEVQMAGSGPVLISDNLFFCRYRHVDDTEGTSWSAYAGAANSREPDPSSPSAEIDTAYVAQLAPGWVKRVTNAVNLFDARISDFRNNDVPASYTSMIQEAGQRQEGPVAFNPDKDAIENVGLIELYETVLDRAEELTIDNQAGSDGVNTALLNAANRIAGLYTLLGNEAFADALDPTIGYSTTSGDFGNLAPSIHAFQNVTGNLLEEELTLLRGRGEVGARPAYNRLLWNFTNGEGEAAYVLNYDINDVNEDGFITDADARRLYPQGHGDAWGHYTMALRGYYRLGRLDNFFWSARSEKYNIDGIVVDVDYLDERAFARTAALRAQTGAAITDLTYRSAYTENPAGQWQGYRDVNTDRAWGVFETAQRAGSAALYDWMTANALLPAEEADSSKTGIRKVDRTTVEELRVIAQEASNIQAKLDLADRGMNPSGLDPNTIAFDIDPNQINRTYESATHFEQVYERAVGSLENAYKTYEHANRIALQLRETEANADELRKEAIDQDSAFRNELIQYFGTPYEGMVGAGKAYPAGYHGPDLYLYMYVDQVAAGGDVLPELGEETIATTIVPGLRNLASDTNPFVEGSVPVHENLEDTVSKYFPTDLDLPNEEPGNISLNLPKRASGYGLVAPDGWGARSSPGEIQAAIQDLVHAQWKVRQALNLYEGQAADFQVLLKTFELKSGIAASSLEISRHAKDEHSKWIDVATGTFAAAHVLDNIRESVNQFAEAGAEIIPENVGLATSAGAPTKGGILFVAASTDAVLRSSIVPLQITQYRAELEADKALAELDIALLTLERRSELVDILADINDLVNNEVVARADVIDSVETMRAASDRVRTVMEEAQALLEDRIVFNQRVASTTTKQRYEDYTFRVFHNEALRKYRASFDLALRYAHLAGKAYQYELNLPDNHPANAMPLLSRLQRTRSLGVMESGEPVIGHGGIAEVLAILSTNFETLKGQMGFSASDFQLHNFSLRAELSRTGMSSRVNADWRTALENWRVPDLWNYEYEHNGVNYGYVFRRYCRPFAPEAAGAQPALVIPFSSTIEGGKNWFGEDLQGGDSSFNPSHFSTKIRSVGVRLDGYNNAELSQTPQVYLVPVGMDRMFYPDSRNLDFRSWNVVDQRIPAPLAIGSAQLSDEDWQPYTGSTNGFFEELRKFGSFRAYHDAGGWDEQEMLSTRRHVGRSVWNTQWVLIIPDASLLNDPANPQAGLDTLIYGAPLMGYDQSTAGTANRDLLGIRDIRLLIESYSVSGN